VLVSGSDAAGVRTLTLNRPEKRNAFSAQLLADVGLALTAADADPAVAVILLTGAGPSFSAGADLTEMAGTGPVTDATRDGKNSKDYFDELIELLTNLHKPLLVAVNGPAAGFGMTILGYADLVFMSTETRLRCPFTEMGLAPEAASSFLLPALVGRQNAAWILLSSEWVSAEEAHAMGLAWKLCEPDELLPTATGYAERLAARPAASLAAVKRTMLAPHRDEIAAAHAREMAAFAELMPGLTLPT
jgi:enoyl-CoA hydratase/carnithine racemase